MDNSLKHIAKNDKLEEVNILDNMVYFDKSIEYCQFIYSSRLLLTLPLWRFL